MARPSRKSKRVLEPPRVPADTSAVATPAERLAPATWIVAPLVFGSGLCALVYQTAWQREFRLVFGASTAASAAVIAVFMGGLGLGGWVLGPRADRRANALRFYALLEASVAMTALATPTLLQLARRVYLGLGGTTVLGDALGTAVRLGLAGLVLLPPTFLAGGTLGAAARAADDGRDVRRRGTALLYGVNTLGAVAGCLASTFWLLEAFGTRSTLYLAAAVNLAIAAAAALLSRRTGGDAPAVPVAVPARDAAPPATFVVTAAAIVGFAFFLMELVWYRMLGPILGGTVYTFGLVLAVALAGVALGGLGYASIARRAGVTTIAFAVTCLLEAGAMALPYVLGDGVALLANALRPPAGSPLGGYLGGWTLVTSLVVLPASLVAGAQFPLLVALLGGGREALARNIGRAYFWNTVGGIAGALAGGFGLMPMLSAPGCWRAVTLLLAGLALAAALVGRRPRAAGAIGAGGLFVSAVLLLATGPTAVWRHSGIGVGRAGVPASPTPNALLAWVNETRRSIVWEREGVESSVALQALAALSFVVNGKVDGNARNDAPTQVMSGMLGALLCPHARRSLVIGLGTGSTAGWLAALPTMERTDVVELEPAIVEVARRCAAVNHGALDNPRVRVVTGDAREILTTGRDRYDLVFSEPSNPYRAGIASLFTREFYQAIDARLEDDGLFLQWVQAYDIDEGTIATIVATVGSVFPDVEIWQIHQTDLLLVASRRSRRLDAATLRARIREQPFADALGGAWRAVALEDVLARFVAGSAVARDMRAAQAALNTDDRNPVEFAFARTLSRAELFDIERLRRRAAALGAARPRVDGSVDWERVTRQRLAIYTIAGTRPVVPEDATDAYRLRAQAHAEYLAGKLKEAVATFGRQPEPPEGPLESAIFAEGLAEQGDPAAAGHIRALHDAQPTEADAATARLALRLGQTDLARNALAAAFVRYRTDPWASQVSMSHALALADEMTLAHPETVPILFEALREPFAAAALEEPRELIRLSVLAHGGPSGRCGEVMAPFEPYVPWRADVLKYRSDCYSRIGHPLAGDARVDLETFERKEREK